MQPGTVPPRPKLWHPHLHHFCAPAVALLPDLVPVLRVHSSQQRLRLSHFKLYFSTSCAARHSPPGILRVPPGRSRPELAGRRSVSWRAGRNCCPGQRPGKGGARTQGGAGQFHGSAPQLSQIPVLELASSEVLAAAGALLWLQLGRPDSSRDGLQTRDVISRHADLRRGPHRLKCLLCGCGRAPDADPGGACGVHRGRPGGAPGSSGLGLPALGRVRPRCSRCACCCCCRCWAARAHSTPATCATGKGGEFC